MMQKRGSRRASLFVLIFGLLVTSVATVLLIFFPQSVDLANALFIALLGILITLGLDVRLQASELHQRLDSVEQEQNHLNRITDDSINQLKILELSQADPYIATKHEELRSQIADLARGRYFITSLASLYLDDIKSIDALKKGEVLLSTCPVNPASLEEAKRQLTDIHYDASIEAHTRAAKRGVKVTRIYLLGNKSVLDDPWIKKHLTDLKETNFDVRVIVRSEVNIEGEFDFLIFGKRKVSRGIAEPGAGTVNGAVVDTDPLTVAEYAEKYQKLIVVSKKV